MVTAVVWYAPANRTEKADAIIEVQKLPWPAVTKKKEMGVIRLLKTVIQPLTIGFFFSNLSPIMPPKRLDMNPQQVRIKALSVLYYILKAG